MEDGRFSLQFSRLWSFLSSSLVSTTSPCFEFPANTEVQRSSVPGVGIAGHWTARNERLCRAYLVLALKMKFKEVIHNHSNHSHSGSCCLLKGYFVINVVVRSLCKFLIYFS